MGNILAKKIGMTQIYDEQGNFIPVTVVEAGPCVITQLKTVDKDGYSAVALGFGKARKQTKMKKYRRVREFRLEKTDDLKVGQELTTALFNPGDLLTISGVSIGKGFAGNVKRHKHHRGLMTHGSKSHRITGSIGAGTTPGRVFKGTRMPGRMGCDQITVKDVKVVQVDAEKNLLLLKGALPGKRGNLLKIARTFVASIEKKQDSKKQETKKEEAKEEVKQ